MEENEKVEESTEVQEPTEAVVTEPVADAFKVTGAEEVSANT